VQSSSYQALVPFWTAESHLNDLRDVQWTPAGGLSDLFRATETVGDDERRGAAARTAGSNARSPHFMETSNWYPL
jgi:hypothetical protein